MASNAGAGARAGAGVGAGRARQRSRAASAVADASGGGQGAGAGAGAGAAASHANIRISVAWGGVVHHVPVRPGQTVEEVGEAVRKRRPGALRRPRLFLARDGGLLWPEDVAMEVLREDDTVTAEWDRSLREVLAASPAMLMVAECLFSWAELCALGATCSDALRAVRSLQLDWDMCAFDEDVLFERNSSNPRVAALGKLNIWGDQVAAWRVSFPHARCCRLQVLTSPLTEAARSSLRGVLRLRLAVPHSVHVTVDDFKELGGVVDLTTHSLCTDAWAGSPALAVGRLTNLRRLRLVQIGEDQVNPAVYKALARAQLEMLVATNVFIRDEDVQWLPVTLRRLMIGGWDDEAAGGLLSDEGCASLTRLTQLTHLYVDSRRVTDVGVSHIAQLTSLTRLELTVSITDAGLGHVGGMVGLHDLQLRAPRAGDVVTDAGMAQLGRLTALRRLWLKVRRTAVTPAALASLATCTHLHHLVLYGKAPFNGDRRVLRAVDVASLASLKRVTVGSSEALSEEEEAELAARGVEVEHVATWV